MTAWSAAPQGGLWIQVKVQPKAAREKVGGLAASVDGDRLRIAVTSAPEDGKATDAAMSALARALDTNSSTITLVRGATSRQKTFHIAGDVPRLTARLEKL
jgi:uncharacterized protein (TIGR00251 family)